MSSIKNATTGADALERLCQGGQFIHEHETPLFAELAETQTEMLCDDDSTEKVLPDSGDSMVGD